MEVRLPSLELILSLSYKDWRKETGCLNLTTVHAVRKCELTMPGLINYVLTDTHILSRIHCTIAQLYSITECT